MKVKNLIAQLASLDNLEAEIFIQVEGVRTEDIEVNLFDTDFEVAECVLSDGSELETDE